jgi:multimeric flavodoxin WrbA
MPVFDWIGNKGDAYMKVIVLNGSPKGENSATMQYIYYIRKKFPRHELQIINISQRITKIEKDEKTFQDIIDTIRISDCVIWATPVYVSLVPSQYKRFIELITERNVADVFRNKYTAVFTTSIHFYDHTAHNYLNAVCDDLGMRYIDTYSADMYDLLRRKERRSLEIFAENMFESIEDNVSFPRRNAPLVPGDLVYTPGDVVNPVDAGDKKVLVVTDAGNMDGNLGRMITRFASSFTGPVEIVNLSDIDIKGGCLGCIHCGIDGECVYEGRDEFIEFYRTKVQTADILVLAGAVKDRFLSWKWKQYLDRRFFHNHIPSLPGKQLGIIISGPASQIQNLHQILDAYGQWEQATLVGCVTDEYVESSLIDDLLQNLAERLVNFSNKEYKRPVTFLGLGGAKIFRDDIWGRLRIAFQADHKYYKKHGMYDFPQNNYKLRFFNWKMMLLTKIPAVRRAFPKRVEKEIIKPLQNVLKKMEKDK